MAGEYYRPVFEDLARLDKFKTIELLLQDIIPEIPKFDVEWLDVIFYGYYKAKNPLKAIEWGNKALAVSNIPMQKCAIRQNLSKVYLSANYPEKCKELMELNLKLGENSYENKLDYSVALFACNEKDKSFDILNELYSDPNIDEKTKKTIEFNLGTHYLYRDEFKKGITCLNKGRELKIWGSYTHKFPIPLWDGKPQKGKTIMLVGEGGIGDEIINVRFVHKIREMGMKPHIASCHKMTDIYSRLPFESSRNYVKFTNDIPDMDKFDYWAPLMDLPRIIGVNQDELWFGPYLTVSEKHRDKWKNRFSKDKIKIALKWAGNPLYEHDLHRSIPIKKIVDLLGHNNFELISVQKDHDLEPLKDMPNVIDIGKELESFDDLLAVLEQVDVVITSCTSIAHAAGALDKKTFVLTPIMQYYVWCNKDKNHTPWYSKNLTIIAQQKPRDWDSPINELKTYIDEMVK